MENIGFIAGDILIPKQQYLENWSVVAVDQFTSEPDYWKAVAQQTAGVPSAYHITFPEIYLKQPGFDHRVETIQQNMKQYLDDEVFTMLPNSMIYLERTLPNGAVRRGLIGLLDLAAYDYHAGAQSLIRATEGTIIDRLPPRVKIRQNALLEIPHILILIDDERQCVIEPLASQTEGRTPCYDFPLMQKGGHVRGCALTDAEITQVQQALLTQRERSAASQETPFLYAVGDGNHSLAAAKDCFEQLRKTLSEADAMAHPARYALVELNNLHDPSLIFEPIHRVLFNTDPKQFIRFLSDFCASLPPSPYPPQTFTICIDGTEQPVILQRPPHPLTVGSVQQIIDSYLAAHTGSIDYIHGDAVVRSLSSSGAIGFLLPAMDKRLLFPAVQTEGALPRKTFSMGEAAEKRYYLECRKIR